MRLITLFVAYFVIFVHCIMYTIRVCLTLPSFLNISSSTSFNISSCIQLLQCFIWISNRGFVNSYSSWILNLIIALRTYFWITLFWSFFQLVHSDKFHQMIFVGMESMYVHYIKQSRGLIICLSQCFLRLIKI